MNARMHHWVGGGGGGGGLVVLNGKAMNRRANAKGEAGPLKPRGSEKQTKEPGIIPSKLRKEIGKNEVEYSFIA